MNPLLGILLAALLGGAGAASCFGGYALYPWCDEDLCAGSCTLNGCLCSNSSIICIPNNATPCVLNSSACCPAGLYWYPAQACCSAEPACSPECFDDEICTDFNGTTQCSCNRTRYQLLDRYDLQPVVQCRGLWMNISISRCLLESFGFDSSTISLRNDTSGCTTLNQGILDNKSVVTVPVLLQAGWCGNEILVNASRMRYSNVLHVRPASSVIVRVNPLFLSFSCSITRAVSTQLELVLSSSSTPGARFARDVSLPSTVSLNAPPLYVGLKVTTSDTSRIALRTEQCFSNPFGDPSVVNSVQLITDGHAADQGVSTRVIENGNSSVVKLALGMFRFVNQTQLFIFCTSRLCDPLAENCNNPGLVRNLTLNEVSTTTVFIDWSTPEGGASSYVVKVLGFPAVNTQLSTDYFNVTGLIPGNYYTIQVFAQDGVRLGEASTISAFTVPDVVKNLSASNITTQSVFLSWLPPKGNMTSYVIEVMGEPSKTIEVQSESVLINALTPGHLYTFVVSVLVTNNPLTGEHLAIIEYTVPNVTNNLIISSFTNDAVSLSWLPPTGNKSHYLVQVLGIPASNWTTVSESLTIPMLIAGNTYTFLVSAVAENGIKGEDSRIRFLITGRLFLSLKISTHLPENESKEYILSKLNQWIQHHFPDEKFALQ